LIVLCGFGELEGTSEADADYAMSFSDVKFDSIMIDASVGEPAEKVMLTTKVVEKATALGIEVEAEIGRIRGREAGESFDPKTELDIG
jgi:fructose/tagatose bisphosphate aldolase